jgi:hypothetical protein
LPERAGRPVEVVLAVREELSRWQAARYRVQSLRASLFPGLAGVLLVAGVALAVTAVLAGALMVILGLVP